MKTINYRLSGLNRYTLLSVLTMLGILCSAVFFFQTAFAGVGVGVTPSFPLAVTVGANDLPVTLAITNNSDSGDGNPLTLTSIKMIPSCGAISGTTCSTSDTGVFHVDAAGTGAGADTLTPCPARSRPSACPEGAKRKSRPGIRGCKEKR